MTTVTRNDEIIRTVGSLPSAELAAFLAVAQHGGFRAASRTLGQTPSALSHAVAGLERRLKVKLFHRSTRNVSLTEPGRRLAERLMPALSEIGLAVEELHEQAATSSELVRINCDANAAEQVLMPLLTRFLDAALSRSLPYYPKHSHIGAGMRAFLDFLRSPPQI